MKLNQLIEIFLVSNQNTTFTYGELASQFETSARGVGSAMRSIGKRNMELCNRVVYKNEKR